jgi:hypothetical protein
MSVETKIKIVMDDGSPTHDEWVMTVPTKSPIPKEIRGSMAWVMFASVSKAAGMSESAIPKILTACSRNRDVMLSQMK